MSSSQRLSDPTVGPPAHPPIPRRAALQAGAVGLLGLGLGDLSALRTLAAPTPKRRDKSVIFIFCSGGMSHIDTFDPKPDAPDGVRGPFRPIATATPGLFVSEHLPELAKRSRHWALCRSLSTGTDDHELGHQVILSGRLETPAGFNPNRASATDWPAIAALANYAAARRANLPPAIVLPEKMLRGDTFAQRPGQFAGLLGSRWDPWFLETAAWCQNGWGACPRCYDGRSPEVQDGRVWGPHADPLFRAPSLLLPKEVSGGRFTKRATLLAELDRQRRLLERSAEAERYDHHRRAAVALLARDDTRRALFDVTRADAKTQDRYGRNKFGWSLLLAGRLIEAGASLVQVNLGKTSTWDLHTGAFPILKDLLLPPTDRALSALLDDLRDKGLLDETLIVMTSEFGRTPTINTGVNGRLPGRDHWGDVQTVFFAGGGVRGGRVIGASGKTGARPSAEPHTPDDLAATIYQTLGIPRSATWRDVNGQPHDFYTGAPIDGLFT